MSKNCCFIGRGKGYFKEYDGTCLLPTNSGWKYFGNVKEFSFAPEQTTKEVKDYTSVSGGVDCSQTFTDKITAKLVLTCHKSSNLALAYLGVVNQVAAAISFTDTILTDGSDFYSFTHIADPSTVLVSGGYVAGTDYVVSGSGISIPATSTIPTGTTLTVTYDYLDQEEIEYLTEASKEIAIMFDGMNAGDESPSSAFFNVKAYRIRLGAAKNISFVSEDYVDLELEGSLLKSDCVADTGGISKYMKITRLA